VGKLKACSNVYQNPAIASEPQPDYLNAAVLIETNLHPQVIREKLRQIESSLDRVRTADKYAPRTIDLDLCLYDDWVMNDTELVLPDQDVLVRPHLALSLSELQPEMHFPGSEDTLADIAKKLLPGAQLTDRADVRQIIEGLLNKESPHAS
jgi:2-amino-4-hydroxy-6-hydroxymethyldihydropteridine diphosphokinase